MTVKAENKNLKLRFLSAILALLIALVAVATATFAWYIYHTGNKTSEINMAAGTSDSIMICDEIDGKYSTSTVIKFDKDGPLIPVSTTKIDNGDGFRAAINYVQGDESKGQPGLVANLFGKTESLAFLKETLYLKNTGDTGESGKSFNIYIEDIDLSNAIENKINPISTAIRIGFVTDKGEFIFEANDQDHIANPYYNTDNIPVDGAGNKIIPFAINPDTNKPDKAPTTYNHSHFYSSKEGSVNSGAQSIGTLSGGEPLEVDIYVWLEGCDEDCTPALGGEEIRNFAIKFIGEEQS